MLGIQRSCFRGSTDTDSYKERRACVEAIGSHPLKDKIHGAFISLTRHQYHSVSRKGASAAGHVCIDLASVPARNDLPPDGRSTGACVDAGVVLVKSLHDIRAQRCFSCCLPYGIHKKTFQLIYKREACAALYEELENARVLT